MSSTAMSRAIRIHRPGGPEELRWEEVEVGVLGAGQVRLRHTAVGLNFIDTYHRRGLYPLPTLPTILGTEAAGVVEAVGPGVRGLEPGDRVAYAGLLGSYSEVRLAPAERLVQIPDGIADDTAAAMMLKGMTVEYLLRRIYPVQAGDTILVHAAAGGVGLIACQWARHLGATVIGTVGSRDKADLARAHGCHHPVVYTEEDFVTRVREITGGKGVPVVYDSVGETTFRRSLGCLSPRGMLVAFGQSSGPIAPFDIGELARHGSLFLTRPSLAHYTATRGDLEASAASLFEVVGSGAVKIEIKQRYPLADTRRAHEDLEARRTVGSTVLVP